MLHITSYILCSCSALLYVEVKTQLNNNVRLACVLTMSTKSGRCDLFCLLSIEVLDVGRVGWSNSSFSQFLAHVLGCARLMSVVTAKVAYEAGKNVLTGKK